MKAIYSSLLSMALLLSACGSKNEQKELVIKDEVPEVLSPKGATLPINSSGTFSFYIWNENPSRWLELNDNAVQRSGKHVIVNAANEWMAYDGSSGAHQEIVEAAGRSIIDAEVEAQKGRYFKAMPGKDNLGGGAYILNPGDAMTTTAGNLKAKGTKYIIHSVGPRFGSDVKEKAATLKTTYESVFTEMNTLHEADNKITELALMPISAGVFNGGDQNIPAIYDILISSTIDAMRKYEWLQPSIYTYNKENLELMKSRVLANKGFLLAGKGSFSSDTSLPSSLSAVTISKQALLDSSAYTSNFGSMSAQGAAASFGSMRVMGNTARGVNIQLTQLAVGKMYNAHFIGCEFETAYSATELTSYSIKAIALTHITDNIKLASGFGYICEAMNARFPNNMRHFLNQLGIDTTSFKRHGVVGDLSAQYHVKISSNISFTGNVGLRATYTDTMELNPFAQVECQFSGLNVAVTACQADVGLNLGYQY
jgi:O-acetyl-ADP-ribose deacetylase (regulator of RNase III)